MKIKPIAAVLATATAFTLVGCAANEAAGTGGTSSAAAQTLTGKGASSMKAAQEKWVADFQTANTGITVNYSPEGSSAGRSAFTAGAVQFAGSDRPLKDEEMGAGKFATCAADSNALNLPVNSIGPFLARAKKRLRGEREPGPNGSSRTAQKPKPEAAEPEA